MLRLLTFVYIAAALAGCGLSIASLFRPPVHDGAWLLAVLCGLLAVGGSIAVAALTKRDTPTTTNRNET